MKVFGLIGYPLGHSFSKDYFTKKFFREKTTDSIYKNFEMTSLDSFTKTIKEEKNLIGLNVTIPYKENIIRYLDKVDSVANEIGSVNVIKVMDNKLIGFNSDYLGFKISLEKWLPNRKFNALVLGSGGSSNAICFALKKLDINYKIVSTSNPSYFSYEDIINEEIYSKYKLIINTTPLGMSPNIDSFPDIQYKFLNNKSYLYDLVYNPKQTKFLSKGRKNNSNIKNGLEMLETQAKISWDIWNK
ncbi:MAG: shikimate dehydrogenase [Flammeovirgaceae bacterium TMED290]|nr:MAG: shikimate dehydrogenase [Flammeovirgaceae bacterium TMED290]|tara:strand:- start:15388 stop:16119 length:732 start_codon:yes stop_codon:yes gene_type:complete